MPIRNIWFSESQSFNCFSDKLQFKTKGEVFYYSALPKDSKERCFSGSELASDEPNFCKSKCLLNSTPCITIDAYTWATSRADVRLLYIEVNKTYWNRILIEEETVLNCPILVPRSLNCNAHFRILNSTFRLTVRVTISFSSISLRNNIAEFVDDIVSFSVASDETSKKKVLQSCEYEPFSKYITKAWKKKFVLVSLN